MCIYVQSRYPGHLLSPASHASAGTWCTLEFSGRSCWLPGVRRVSDGLASPLFAGLSTFIVCSLPEFFEFFRPPVFRLDSHFCHRYSTFSAIVSWMASVSLLHAVFNSPVNLMLVGGVSLSSLTVNTFMNSSQLMLWKFLGGLLGVLAKSRSKDVSIERWSVLMPGLSASASHT